MGFIGVYIILLISAQKHRLWVLVEAVLRSTHNLCLEHKYEKYQKFLSAHFHCLVVKFSVHLNRHVFVMHKTEILIPIRRVYRAPLLNRGIFNRNVTIYILILVSFGKLWEDIQIAVNK